MTEHLLALLLDVEKRNGLFDQYLATDPDLSRDCFLDEFQEKFADRNKLKQDFTPAAVCQLVAQLAPTAESVLDVCAGTGALTITKWQQCPNARFYCQEYSKEAIAVLLFNLCVRGINAEVSHCDVLTGEVFAAYRLTRNGKYSDIEQTALNWQGLKVDCVISNPPYSAKWQPQNDERFEGFALAPKSAADFAFVLHGLHHLKEDGTASFILPHGVLFRGNAEGKIRTALIEQGYFYSLIGLPQNLFLNTSIPTAIITLKKRKERDLFIVDASDLFIKDKSINLMLSEHVSQILTAHQLRRNIDKLAYLADLKEIQQNEFNLNIPRYVDKHEPEPEIDILQEAKELLEIHTALEDSGKQFIELLEQLEVTTGNAQEVAEFAEAKQLLKQVFAPNKADVQRIEDIINKKQSTLFVSEEEVAQITGFIEREEQKIAKLESIKKFFLRKMFV